MNKLYTKSALVLFLLSSFWAVKAQDYGTFIHNVTEDSFLRLHANDSELATIAAYERR